MILIKMIAADSYQNIPKTADSIAVLDCWNLLRRNLKRHDCLWPRLPSLHQPDHTDFAVDKDAALFPDRRACFRALLCSSRIVSLTAIRPTVWSGLSAPKILFSLFSPEPVHHSAQISLFVYSYLYFTIVLMYCLLCGVALYWFNMWINIWKRTKSVKSRV